MSQSQETIITRLTQQFSGLFTYYQQMLDDPFLFASAVQVPQAATIFDVTDGKHLAFGGLMLGVPQLLSLIAYRYGFGSMQRRGHGGYAIVLGHAPDDDLIASADARRVLRLVPDHHVQDVLGDPDKPRSFDVQLDFDDNPIRHPRYPLLISDIFLMPRHTSRLVFYSSDGKLAQAGGRPAILHCQLLPEVLPMNDSRLDRRLARAAGELLETALASVGAYVADAHGGNGGVLLDLEGEPLRVPQQQPDGTLQAGYIPVVLDYGYYSEIGVRALARVLVRNRVQAVHIRRLLAAAPLAGDHRAALVGLLDPDPAAFEGRLAQIIEQSELPNLYFGNLLYHVDSPALDPDLWLDPSGRDWQTVKETRYPPLSDQSRLHTLYPAYSEIIFPQHIETYHLPLIPVRYGDLR